MASWASKGKAFILPNARDYREADVALVLFLEALKQVVRWALLLWAARRISDFGRQSHMDC